MMRWLFHILAAISLLLSLATVASWVRSHWYNDRIFRYTSGIENGMMTWRGQLRLYQIDHREEPTAPIEYPHKHALNFDLGLRWESHAWNDRFSGWRRSIADLEWILPKMNDDLSDTSPPPLEKHWAGCEWYTGNFVGPSEPYTIELHRPAWVLTLPMAYPLGLFALTPLAWVLIRRPWQHLRCKHPGLCPKCAYDLRAHRLGDRCPECGTPIPSVTTPNLRQSA